MVSVVKNYLGYNQWGDCSIKFVPTHYDTNKYLLIVYFCIRFLQIWWMVTFEHYDIAHLHVAERGSFWRKRFLLKFFHYHGIKVVLHHHGAEFEEFYTKCSENQKKKIQRTLNEADVNIVLSKRLVPMIKEKAPNACVEVLYNSVPCSKYNPYSLEAKNILFLGRLGGRKGTFDLLLAIKKIDVDIPKDVKFYFCGDMGEDMVRKKVGELGINHRIAHIGWVDGKQKEEFISNTMINCLPSYNEGLPMTILETMAKGIPNISTDIASIPEVIVDGENGYLIKPGDVEALSNKLILLINNSDLRQIFSQNSFRCIRDGFSIDSHISHLKCIYDNLLDNKYDEKA